MGLPLSSMDFLGQWLKIGPFDISEWARIINGYVNSRGVAIWVPCYEEGEQERKAMKYKKNQKCFKTILKKEQKNIIYELMENKVKRENKLAFNI